MSSNLSVLSEKPSAWSDSRIENAAEYAVGLLGLDGVKRLACREIVKKIVGFQVNGRFCKPSVQWFVSKLGFCRRTVQKYLRLLENAGLVSVASHFSKANGMQLANEYRVSEDVLAGRRQFPYVRRERSEKEADRHIFRGCAVLARKSKNFGFTLSSKTSVLEESGSHVSAGLDYQSREPLPGYKTEEMWLAEFAAADC